MIIGIDDTDSSEGMCTTYLTAVLINKIKRLGDVQGMPHLIRLNPNIKYKTRGNAALALEFNPNPAEEETVINTAVSLIKEMADLQCENTNPGIVFLTDDQSNNPVLQKELEKFMYRTVRSVLEVNEAHALIDKYHLIHKGFKNGRGLIGALAACGALINELPDHTFERIAYRQPENFGTLRDIDHESVFLADKKTYPGTWDTVDISNNVVVFAPHSPDPVLFGIRGDDIDAIEQAFGMIVSEPVGLTLMYKTNQGTDWHLQDARICDVCELGSYRVEGTVADQPVTIRGGHVFFTLEESGILECAAFEPTKGLRNIIRELIPGDRVRICGSIISKTLNIEKIEILGLVELKKTLNPLCSSCGRRMKSAGCGQGFRCKHCGTKNDSVIKIPVKRNIRSGIYEVPPSARRHISKPLIRSGSSRAFPSR
jgi:tRNA(Ile2)-agmatinylcytidine synthase